MDELEDRLAALELLAVELLADVAADRLTAARERISAGVAGAVDDRERAIRLQALQHLDDALQRHDQFAAGVLYRPRDV